MSLSNISIGSKAPEVINAVVEIQKGSHNKYEYDEKTGVITLDRVLYSAMHYLTDYGFIPETRSEDGDHLDVLVLGGDPVFPGCVVRVRPVGLLKMIDGGTKDFKIIGVQEDNPRFNAVKDLKDVEASNPHFLKEVAHFFERYKDLQGKKVQIEGWGSREDAISEINRAREMFRGK
jgi:inorganic pyrophosphatase